MLVFDNFFKIPHTPPHTVSTPICWIKNSNPEPSRIFLEKLQLWRVTILQKSFFFITKWLKKLIVLKKLQSWRVAKILIFIANNLKNNFGEVAVMKSYIHMPKIQIFTITFICPKRKCVIACLFKVVIKFWVLEGSVFYNYLLWTFEYIIRLQELRSQL